MTSRNEKVDSRFLSLTVSEFMDFFFEFLRTKTGFFLKKKEF